MSKEEGIPSERENGSTHTVITSFSRLGGSLMLNMIKISVQHLMAEHFGIGIEFGLCTLCTSRSEMIEAFIILDGDGSFFQEEISVCQYVSAFKTYQSTNPFLRCSFPLRCTRNPIVSI